MTRLSLWFRWMSDWLVRHRVRPIEEAIDRGDAREALLLIGEWERIGRHPQQTRLRALAEFLG